MNKTHSNTKPKRSLFVYYNATNGAIPRVCTILKKRRILNFFQKQLTKGCFCYVK